MKKLISEQQIIDAAKKGEKHLTYEPGTIITSAARDRAQQLRVKLIEKTSSTGTPMPAAGATQAKSAANQSVIAIGSDHGGFALKEQLKPYIESLSYKVVDLGTYSDEACDYPDYAYAVARMVALGQAGKGIMIDAIGIASAMAANKVKGVRAAGCFDEFSARSSREHNDANVLTLGGRVLGIELAKAITKAWLETNFGGGRHQKRVQKISDIESRS